MPSRPSADARKMQSRRGIEVSVPMNEPGKYIIINDNKVIADNLPTLKSATNKARKLEWLAYDSHQYLIVQVVADAKKI